MSALSWRTTRHEGRGGEICLPYATVYNETLNVCKYGTFSPYVTYCEEVFFYGS